MSSSGKKKGTRCPHCEATLKSPRGLAVHLRRSHPDQQDPTPEKERNFSASQQAFLVNFSETGNVTVAAEAAKIHRSTPYDWARADKAFARAWDEAREQAADHLVEEARRRAAVGTEKPVFYQGKVCGTVTEYSDTLLIFLLKGLRPETYRERHAHEHSGPGGGPIRTEASFDPRELPDDELRRLASDDDAAE